MTRPHLLTNASVQLCKADGSDPNALNAAMEELRKRLADLLAASVETAMLAGGDLGEAMTADGVFANQGLLSCARFSTLGG